MEFTLSTTCRLLVAYLTTLCCGFGVRGLHNLEISVPSAVLVGETVALECTWDFEDEEALYSVKWYRGKDEFYRYIPKELPHTRVFPQPGIQVDISHSGARRVVLQQATPAMAGRFRCEVSADAPTFHTEIRSAHLDVVEAPARGPKLQTDRSWYGAGSVLRASCAAPPAYPPANITWMLNGREVESDVLTHTLPDWFEWDSEPKPDTTTSVPDQLTFNAFGDESLQYLDHEYVEQHSEDMRRKPKDTIVKPFVRTGPDNRQPSFSELSLVVTSDAFERSSLRLTCVVTLYNLYAARAELLFDMEQPEVASVLGVRNNSSGTRWCVEGALLLIIINLVTGYLLSYR